MTTESTTTSRSPKVMSATEANAGTSGALLLDVRTPPEFESAHIEGALLHPLSELDPDQVRTLAEGKPYCLVICQSGIRARQAAQKLYAAGMDTVRILDGGIQAWEDKDLPLVRGRKTLPLERQVRIGAGTLVLTGILLGVLVNPWWIALSGFVGAGLVFAGITNTCGMALLLARMPWNR